MTVFTCSYFNLRLNMRFPKQMLPAIMDYSGMLNYDVRKLILVTELQYLVLPALSGINLLNRRQL